MKDKFLEIIKKKWLRSAALTVLLFAIIICAYVGIIYGIDKVKFSDLDFTKEKIYSISKETKDKLENLEEDVTITVYNMYEYVNDFAYKYANLNKHIKVEELDNLTSKTEWKTNFGVQDTDSFLMIQTETKEKILFESDLYTIDYTTYEQIDTTEEAITNAIIDVTTNVKPKVCFLEGHNLYSEEYFSYLENSIYAEANTVEHTDLLIAGKVPEDCKLLIITALKEDITEKERDLILDYTKKGGELLLLLDPNLEKIKTPNFNKVLNEYGVSVSEGILIEGDSNKMMPGFPNLIVSTVNSTSEIVKNVNMDMNLFMMNSGKLILETQDELEKKNVTAETIATVSNKAFYRTDLTSESHTKTGSDEDAGASIIAAMLTKQIDENTNSKIIIFANTVFATNLTIQYANRYAVVMYNNEDLLLNSVSYLTERDDNITIRKDIEAVSAYDITAMQLRVILSIIYAIPAIIIFVGILVWILRRRKK